MRAGRSRLLREAGLLVVVLGSREILESLWLLLLIVRDAERESGTRAGLDEASR